MILWIVLVACPPVAVLLGAAVARRRFAVVRVVGTSMVPTLLPGERLLVRRGPSARVHVGAVVVLRQPPDDWQVCWENLSPAAGGLAGTRWAIKRVAAVAGEAVPEPVRRAVGGVAVVPPGMLVVLGDNSPSTDSRNWGFLPARHVLGVVARRLSRAA
jgi:signal peptidase I